MPRETAILPSVALFWAFMSVLVGIAFGFIGRFFYRRAGVYVRGDEYRFAFWASVGQIVQFSCLSVPRSHFVFGDAVRGGAWSILWTVSFYSASIIGFKLARIIKPISAIPDEKTWHPPNSLE